jgi:hypothetical protein
VEATASKRFNSDVAVVNGSVSEGDVFKAPFRTVNGDIYEGRSVYLLWKLCFLREVS